MINIEAAMLANVVASRRCIELLNSLRLFQSLAFTESLGDFCLALSLGVIETAAVATLQSLGERSVVHLVTGQQPM
jgi:hypothetical protein